MPSTKCDEDGSLRDTMPLIRNEMLSSLPEAVDHHTPCVHHPFFDPYDTKCILAIWIQH